MRNGNGNDARIEDGRNAHGEAAAMPPAVIEASGVLKALAHPARLLIVGHLLDGEKSVGEIERDLDLRQPSLSQQLRHLREAGVVATRREAKSVYYRLADERVALLLREIGDIFGNEGRTTSLAPAQPAPPPAGRATCAPRRVATIGECAIFPVAGPGTRRR